MRGKRVVACILLLMVLLPAVPRMAALENQTPWNFDVETSANAVLLQNLDTGTIAYEKNADERVHPASITKIMSAALAMEMCPDLEGTIVTVPEGLWEEFYGYDIATAGLRVGEELTMLELIYCMMLQSANEAASTVANYYGRDAFIQKMNDKAYELGCRDTHFTNPHGVFVQDHYTTARDTAIITRWAVSVPGFWEISCQSRYDKRETNKNDAVTLVTTNLMQDKISRYYTDYIRGVKTGTHEAAGRCLVSIAQKDGMTWLLVVLGAPFATSDRVWQQGEEVYTDTRLCFDWAFENLTLRNIVNPGVAVCEVKIRFAARRDNLLLYPEGEIQVLSPKNEEDLRKVEYVLLEAPDSVQAPVESEQVLGRAKVLLDGQEIGEINLVTHERIERDNFVMVMDLITQALYSTVAQVIYIVLLALVLFYLYYAKVIVPHARKKQQKKRQQDRRR